MTQFKVKNHELYFEVIKDPSPFSEPGQVEIRVIDVHAWKDAFPKLLLWPDVNCTCDADTIYDRNNDSAEECACEEMHTVALAQFQHMGIQIDDRASFDKQFEYQWGVLCQRIDKATLKKEMKEMVRKQH